MFGWIRREDPNLRRLQQPQIEEKQGNRPDGASGIHSRKTDL